MVDRDDTPPYEHTAFGNATEFGRWLGTPEAAMTDPYDREDFGQLDLTGVPERVKVALFRETQRNLLLQGVVRRNEAHVKRLAAAGVRLLFERNDAFEALRAAEATIEHLTSTQNLDKLTGLPNRDALVNDIEETMVGWQGALTREATRGGRYITPDPVLGFYDLDNFKAINDVLGHRVGDFMIVVASRAMHGALRRGEKPYRFAGDEFATIHLDLEDINQLQALHNRISLSVEGAAQRIASEDDLVAEILEICKDDVRDLPLEDALELIRETIASLSISCGYIRFHSDLTADELLIAADTAMYQAKRAKKMQQKADGEDKPQTTSASGRMRRFAYRVVRIVRRNSDKS